MTIPEILKALEHESRGFPMEAMQAAVAQREAITPELLRVVETAAQDPVQYSQREDSMVFFFALFLLAQFREKRAYPLLIKIFSAPGDTPHDLAGEGVSSGLSQILASVYDGDLAPLHGLIENKEADEYVRSSAIETLLVLEHTGQISRAEVADYFRRLFQGKLERSSSFAWDRLVSAVTELPAPELMDDVRQAYASHLADPGVAGLDDLERDLAAHEPPRREGHVLITDAIEELKDWVCFDPEEYQPKDIPERQPFPLEPPPQPVPPPEPYVPPVPFVRPPKIGRNDPCPCGSGKKYKKCCGKG